LIDTLQAGMAMHGEGSNAISNDVDVETQFSGHTCHMLDSKLHFFPRIASQWTALLYVCGAGVAIC
jgi:hypothetical protein